VSEGLESAHLVTFTEFVVPIQFRRSVRIVMVSNRDEIRDVAPCHGVAGDAGVPLGSAPVSWTRGPATYQMETTDAGIIGICVWDSGLE
jgi:hypothetical protein